MKNVFIKKMPTQKNSITRNFNYLKLICIILYYKFIKRYDVKRYENKIKFCRKNEIGISRNLKKHFRLYFDRLTERREENK